jgi:hypothetical protein
MREGPSPFARCLVHGDSEPEGRADGDEEDVAAK